MKKILFIFVVGFMAALQPVYAASELSQVQAQIKKTEQQNQKISEQVKTSERALESTKKKLVKVADQVSTLEEQRGAVAKKIREKDADYILSLKGNQAGLYDDVKLFIDEYCKDKDAKKTTCCWKHER